MDLIASLLFAAFFAAFFIYLMRFMGKLEKTLDAAEELIQVMLDNYGWKEDEKRNEDDTKDYIQRL